MSADRGPSGLVPGGAVYYGAAAAAAFGWDVCVATVGGEEFGERPPFPEWLDGSIEWHAAVSELTTSFENRYDERGRRRQRLHALARPIRASDLPPACRAVDVLHVAPLAGEVDAPAVEAVEARFVGLAAQGWLRSFGPDGEVTAGPWRVPEALLSRADALALSDEDLAAGDTTAEHVAALVPVLALTMGPTGVTVFEHGRATVVPVVARASRDPTGAGDVFAATFFAALAEGTPAAGAARLAALAAGHAVQRDGLAGLAARDVLEGEA